MSASVDVGFDLTDPSEYLGVARWLAVSFAGFNTIADQVSATLIIVGLLVLSSIGFVGTAFFAVLAAFYGFGVATVRLVVWGLTGHGRLR